MATILFRKVQERAVKTEDVSTAVKFMARRGWKAEYVDDKPVLGICESCEKVILEGEGHAMNPDDGVYLCFSCMQKH